MAKTLILAPAPTTYDLIDVGRDKVNQRITVRSEKEIYMAIRPLLMSRLIEIEWADDQLTNGTIVMLITARMPCILLGVGLRMCISKERTCKCGQVFYMTERKQCWHYCPNCCSGDWRKGYRMIWLPQREIARMKREQR